MTIPVKRIILAASLAALAIQVVAQNSAAISKKTSVRPAVRKHAAGEAAGLESKEAGTNSDTHEDNRGRLTSAHRTQHTQKAFPKTTVRNAGQNHSTAHLQTGQLTTRQKNHLKTKKTAISHPVRSNGPNRKLTEDQKQTSESQDTNTSTIHLKKHNARMF
jgi:hypothetical protein